MSTRRSFFKSLALAGAGVVGCPGLFLPRYEPGKWKAQRGQHGLFYCEFKYFIADHVAQYDRTIFHVRENPAIVKVWEVRTAGLEPTWESLRHAYAEIDALSKKSPARSWYYKINIGKVNYGKTA